MTSIELFNGLNGKTVSRNYLEEILQQAKAENQTAIVYRLSKVLNDNPKYKRFEMTIQSYPHAKGLTGIQHTGDYREALDDCGRLRKGWKFVKGNVVKVEKKEKKEVSKSKKQGIKSNKEATETEKEYKITHEIRLQYPKSYTDADIIASMKKMDKFRKKSKEIQKKINAEKQEELQTEKDLWKKISKKDKEEIKYLEREIKSEEAFMSSLSRDRRAVEEWIKTGDLSVFNHYKIYGADAEAVRKQYERGGIESFRSQYGLAQKRIKKHTTQIEKIKQKYTTEEKNCKTCDKKYKFLIYKTQTSNKYTLAFSFADLADENKSVFDFRKTHKGNGYNEFFVINNVTLLEKYKKGVDYLILSKEDFEQKEFYKLLEKQEVEHKNIFSENNPSEESNEKEAFLQKHKDIPSLEVILRYAQPYYEDSKINKIGQKRDPEPNIIFWKKKSEVRPETNEMILTFKGITKHPLFSKENYKEYVLFRFNKKAEAIFDQWQKILEKNCKTCEKSDFEQVVEPKKKTELKSIEVGKRKKSLQSAQEPVATLQDGQIETISEHKGTKKSVSNKKTAENFGLGLPLTDEIRKKAFTDKGKLRKGWSFTDDKFLTNGKDFYIPHNKPPIFYEEIIKEIEDNSNKKLKELKKLFNEKDADYRKRREIAEKIKKKLGLSVPVVETPQEPTPEVFVEEFTEPTQVQPEPVNPLPEVAHHRKGSLAEQLANAPTQTESYQIDRMDMAQFLGDMEIKNTDSLVITLTGGQGSGKTRFAFQFMNDLAQRYKVGHISIEEHPESRLYIEKAHQYLNQNALNNIEAHDVRSLSEIDKIIRENEVIVIDSFQKIKEIDSKFEVDKDLRKKYNGKLFLVIFQQTTDGKMRGGSKSQFDGDIILFTEKFPNYQENYVYPDKNRYNSIPADQLRYNIFQQRLLPVETEEQTTENQVYDVIY
ncbi:hypothetical protein [Capnocytophaga canis]|uniref:hypothetical protein n=1 Tax=Capnocytophaga canis TaxID=1848903 RepID=UPI0037D47AD5